MITQMDRAGKEPREKLIKTKLDAKTIYDRKGKGWDGRWLQSSSQRYRAQMFWRKVEAVTEKARLILIGCRENGISGGNDGKQDKRKAQLQCVEMECVSAEVKRAGKGKSSEGRKGQTFSGRQISIQESRHAEVGQLQRLVPQKCYRRGSLELGWVRKESHAQFSSFKRKTISRNGLPVLYIINKVTFNSQHNSVQKVKEKT